MNKEDVKKGKIYFCKKNKKTYKAQMVWGDSSFSDFNIFCNIPVEYLKYFRKASFIEKVKYSLSNFK